MAIELPPLPYDYDALEPHVSHETLEFHHDKHHKAYVDKTNELVAGTDLADADLETIVRKAHADKNQKLANQSGQVWNHNFFWQSMTPEKKDPTGRLAELIDRDLGGVAKFAETFKAEGVNHFASGWAWLVAKDGKLAVTSFHDGDAPIAHDGVTPLITCDVWEHAYYLDYQNKRPDFLQAFLDNLINWEFAAKNLEGAKLG